MLQNLIDQNQTAWEPKSDTDNQSNTHRPKLNSTTVKVALISKKSWTINSKCDCMQLTKKISINKNFNRFKDYQEKKKKKKSTWQQLERSRESRVSTFNSPKKKKKTEKERASPSGLFNFSTKRWDFSNEIVRGDGISTEWRPLVTRAGLWAMAETKGWREKVAKGNRYGEARWEW